MTGNSIVLDTNIIIEVFKGNRQIADVLKKQEDICIPVVVLGELYLGAFRSVNKERHLLEINSFIQGKKILSVDTQTAEFYASIKSALLNKGTPIPENDIWIAATALQHQWPLYTNDKHFSHVDHLTLAE